ncbi:sigma-54 dependent transcriptional regulator [Thermithiobacillus plumbiphilus]|uniref:Sigma-54 dependent transcriptional regulator n=1 Tax=Thermithiobacillus plumbiphilus TaxID=1729899 RepID=A0ABU9D5R6_9PROT
MNASLDQNIRALIVDDEPAIRELLAYTLEDMDLQVSLAASVQEARAQLAQGDIQFCLTDLRLPDGSGLEIVSEIQSRYPNIPVAVITAFSSADTAVEAMKAGAFDYVSKPIDVNRLRLLARKALQLAGAKPAAEKCSEDASCHQHAARILGVSPAITRVREQIQRLGRSMAPVHITGESGTGKELVACAIHSASPRASAPFVPVNCGAIPENLIESEFFGYEKGAFTGATQRRAGLFEAANGGTLFLDEVADLPLNMQVKLLRAIQERAVRAVGATREVTVDVRIISATHQDLAQLVAQKRFREDLYYRLNVIPLSVPPLRERREDIPVIAEALLQRVAERQGLGNLALSPAALAWLTHYPFAGNVRELENLLERAAALYEGDSIEPHDLQPPGTSNSETAETPVNLDDTIDATEKRILLDALERANGVKTEAARLLGISFRSFRYRLKKLEMQ